MWIFNTHKTPNKNEHPMSLRRQQLILERKNFYVQQQQTSQQPKSDQSGVFEKNPCAKEPINVEEFVEEPIIFKEPVVK
jgi:hypothetical protein